MVINSFLNFQKFAKCKKMHQFFDTSGSLSYNAPSYISRQADEELYQNLQKGVFCYVLTARQMGKSSLKVQMMNRLKIAGWETASVDLTALGTSGFNVKDWYYSFLCEIADGLKVDEALDAWWETSPKRTPVANMIAFLEEVVLNQFNNHIAIFIDEVDFMLSLNIDKFSTGDFFAAIRCIYNRRSQNKDFKRLHFAIFSTSPYQDFMDKNCSYFNLGEVIWVNNFSIQEATTLESGFLNDVYTNKALLRRIMYWTEGQPYLTQRIAQQVQNIICDLPEVETKVDNIVRNLFFKTSILNDTHFSFIENSILNNKHYLLEMLDIYKQVLITKNHTIDKSNLKYLYLILTGLLQEKEGKLLIKNRIYEQIFGIDWLQNIYSNKGIKVVLKRWGFFQVGGSLSIDAPSYIYRQADKDLYQYLQKGIFCNVLAARQTGKSSLKVRMMNRLVAEGWVAVSVDLTAFGTSGFTTEQWYFSFLFEIADALELDEAFDAWWQTRKERTPVARMSAFWEEVVLRESKASIAIFIDEVDSMLSLDKTQFSTDDFFAAIRATYNKRSKDDNLRRLNFAIFGVATPQDLMSNHERTPFNIGQAVRIENFSSQEATVLQNGFPNDAATNAKLLERILYWTAGHPYLTQELGQKLQMASCSPSQVHAKVDEAVEELFFTADVLNTAHFSNIESRILNNKQYQVRMLDIHKQVLDGGSYSISKRSPEHLYLKLAGLLQEQASLLHLNNRIYEQVFDADWLRKAYDSIQRPFAADLERWRESGSKDALLKGQILKDAEAWAAPRDDLSKSEQDFLNASRLEALREEQTQLRQAEREKQQGRLRLALALALALAIAAGIAAFFANANAKKAVQKEQEAIESAAIAQQRLAEYEAEKYRRDSMQVRQVLQDAETLIASDDHAIARAKIEALQQQKMHSSLLVQLEQKLRELK